MDFRWCSWKFVVHRTSVACDINNFQICNFSEFKNLIVAKKFSHKRVNSKKIFETFPNAKTRKKHITHTLSLSSIDYPKRIFSHTKQYDIRLWGKKRQNDFNDQSAFAAEDQRCPFCHVARRSHHIRLFVYWLFKDVLLD